MGRPPKSESDGPVLSIDPSRRRFLKVALGAGAALVAVACGSTESSEPAPPSPSSAADEAPDGATATLQPTPAPRTTAIPDAPLDQKIAEMIMMGYNGTTLADIDVTGDALRQGHAGNLVMFDRNVVSPEQLASFTASVSGLPATPPLIAIDQEGGFVARLRPDKGFPETVTALFSANQGIEATRQYAATIAMTLKAAGINLNLAPVVDVNVNPDSPAIGYYERSFSADPEAAAQHALAFIRAHHEHGVLTTLKHFPGHGSATGDSHLDVTDVTNTWSRQELIPFQRVIEAGEADVIMTAHLVNQTIDGDYPATLSKPTITGILREELGFDGVIVTDDMQMGAIRQYYGYEHAIELAIQAGADLIAVANVLEYDPALPQKTFDAVMASVQSGAITEERIDQSYQRLMRLKARLA